MTPAPVGAEEWRTASPRLRTVRECARRPRRPAPPDAVHPTVGVGIIVRAVTAPAIAYELAKHSVHIRNTGLTLGVCRRREDTEQKGNESGQKTFDDSHPSNSHGLVTGADDLFNRNATTARL